jgi:hypothetical protein
MLNITAWTSRLTAAAIAFAASLAAAPALHAAEDVVVSDAWARAPAVPGRHGAAFMRLENTTDRVIRLVGAESGAVKRIELHRTTMSDGVMKMAEQDAIEIPAKGMTKLAPGGYHLMLMGAGQSVRAGETLRLTLDFDTGATRTVTADIVGPGQGADMNHDH